MTEATMVSLEVRTWETCAKTSTFHRKNPCNVSYQPTSSLAPLQTCIHIAHEHITPTRRRHQTQTKASLSKIGWPMRKWKTKIECRCCIEKIEEHKKYSGTSFHYTWRSLEISFYQFSLTVSYFKRIIFSSDWCIILTRLSEMKIIQANHSSSTFPSLNGTNGWAEGWAYHCITA